MQHDSVLSNFVNSHPFASARHSSSGYGAHACLRSQPAFKPVLLGCRSGSERETRATACDEGGFTISAEFPSGGNEGLKCGGILEEEDSSKIFHPRADARTDSHHAHVGL